MSKKENGIPLEVAQFLADISNTVLCVGESKEEVEEVQRLLNEPIKHEEEEEESAE